MRKFPPLIHRIVNKIEESQSGCWQWTGSKNMDGYAKLSFRRRDRKWQESVHRIMHELFIGKIPDGFQIDHLCRNRGCVNPAHLEAVIPRVNYLRGVGVCAKNLRKTHCVHGHPFSGENLIVEGNRRKCRECQKRDGEKARKENPERFREASRRWLAKQTPEQLEARRAKNRAYCRIHDKTRSHGHNRPPKIDAPAPIKPPSTLFFPASLVAFACLSIPYLASCPS